VGALLNDNWAGERVSSINVNTCVKDKPARSLIAVIFRECDQVNPGLDSARSYLSPRRIGR